MGRTRETWSRTGEGLPDGDDQSDAVEVTLEATELDGEHRFYLKVPGLVVELTKEDLEYFKSALYDAIPHEPR